MHRSQACEQMHMIRDPTDYLGYAIHSSDDANLSKNELVDDI
jgi:hypothetical protein